MSDNDAYRKIIHVDMDAFFASVEQRDSPELRGKPVAVGYDGPRGVVSTASYEARRYGVHSAMAMAVAKRRCPQLIIVEGHYSRYKEVSQQVHAIFSDYTDLIEPISIDEAFLDVTSNKTGIATATDIARDIKRRIREELQLTASAGVSYNKFLAKIASDYNKPDGLFIVHPLKAQAFIDDLPIEKFWGVGPKTAQQMHRMGIFIGRDLRQVSLAHLKEVFGKAGAIYYDFARGIDDRPVDPTWIRKSVGCEHTFEDDKTLRSQLIIETYHLVLELLNRMEKASFGGKTLTLKVKYADFQTITRSISSTELLRTKDDVLVLARQLLAKVEISPLHAVRLLGLSVSNPPGEDGKKHHEQWVQGYLDFGDGWQYPQQ